MLVPHPLDRPRSSLRLEDEPLGEGGQGVVTRVLGNEKLVYKEYLQNAGRPFAPALAELVEFGRGLPSADSRSLFEQSAWPLARVVHKGAVTGFLMREIPPEFTGPIGGKNRPVELQYLLYKPNHTWQSLHLPDGPGRVEIATAAVRFIDFLHSHRFVLGDISFRNLLWSQTRPYRIFMLDCDGVRRHGGEPVLPQAQTPEWDDPHLPKTGLDLDTDRYKIALLVGRVLSRNAYVRPGQKLELVEGVDSHVADAVTRLFDRAAAPHGLRPTAREWLQALSGRKWIAVKPPPVRVQQATPTNLAPLVTTSQQRIWRPISLPGQAQAPSASPKRAVPPAAPARPRPKVKSVPKPSSASASGPQPASLRNQPGKSTQPSPPQARTPLPARNTAPVARPKLGAQVVASAAFVEQRATLGARARFTDEEVARLIDLLIEKGGRRSVAELARLLGKLPDRIVMELGGVCRLLNLDDEQVLELRDDDQTLQLNIPLLKEQFLGVTS
ncbi:hypothetical protein [Thermomonospora curvata]|uniref:Alkaline phosphatase-like protein PglZ C-terminal domain-containing protein n=1 Tax=Thermomonospora curvata (strain ATCC 19995 / DSM 43183 / JCM 3096 / KCTC 9072 / NBRC 15933 / NCIMB 10081 / Henssen B9) TaxID=471852 RepID=D1AAR5_THECD|nr:hypothetical protein [Thermomonospora curvata]ACY97075.1 hypothetical protein Tcur_1496 [Thermomonospora curvata DSM 43183]